MGAIGRARLATSELTYRQKADTAIRDLILEFECQPILFVGNGLSQRYFGAPTWRDLLKTIFKRLPGGADLFEYHRQKYNDDLIEIGTQLADIIFEWAWKEGRSAFPDDMYTTQIHKDAFLKYLVCQYLEEITVSPENVDENYKSEISALAGVKPHAIITTNYDLFLEGLFEGYETITGQTILRYNANSFGEVFHVHGDISNPESIVLTRRDYDEWSEKKKYISAKLLTYFAEHPVFIMGYGLGDPNVKEILRDIGELVANEDGLIPNVYQIVWHGDDVGKTPPEQAVFAVDGKEYRTMAIHTTDLSWIYDALGSQSALTSINPKLVRALAARTMRLIRHDIPTGSVTVDYDVLERVADDSAQLPKLLGITTVENPNQSHPYTLTQVARRLGFNNWQDANKILNRIKEETGVDLRSSDNRYHCKIKTGVKENSAARKWSHEAVDLFKRVASGSEYVLAP